MPIFLCHPIPNHEVRVSLYVWFLSTLLLLYLSSPSSLPLSLFSLSFTFTLSQNYDDIDLENEPWYKFFSELEFGRPVSQGHSCFFNHNPVIGIHSLSPPHPWLSFFFVPINRPGGASCLGMWYLLGAVNPLYPHPLPTLMWGHVLSVLPSSLVWWLGGTVVFIHKPIVLKE